MKRLDPVRIKRFLSPWMDDMATRYPALANRVVRGVVTAAVERGASVDSLTTNLAPFFPRSKDLKKFSQKLVHALDEFADAGTAVAAARRERSPPRFSRRQHDDKKRDNRVKQVEEVEVAMPAYFVDSDAMSLSKGSRTVKPLQLNEKGEKVDEEGNAVKTQFVVKKGVHKAEPVKHKVIPREFHFLEPGVFTAKAEQKRREKEADAAVANGFPLFDVIALERDVETPEIDWWDLPFVVLDEHRAPVSDAAGNWTPNVEGVNCEYENAAPVPVPHPKVKEIPTMLTEKERKSIRHISRLEKRNQEHLMIKLNLKEKEPQRIKDSQMINFAGGKAVLHPTEVAMSIQKAKEERLKKHMEHNEGRKLTKEQRSEKEAAKRKEDSENNLTVTVYSMCRIENPLHFAKLIGMAEKWFITGGIFLVKSPEMYFVVVESGPKATRKYSALVERRIDWSSSQTNDSGETTHMVSYQGPAFKRRFFNFRKYVFDVGTQCRIFFKKLGAEEMFDSAARAFS